MMSSGSFSLFRETSEDRSSVVHSTYFWHAFFSLYQSRRVHWRRRFWFSELTLTFDTEIEHLFFELKQQQCLVFREQTFWWGFFLEARFPHNNRSSTFDRLSSFWVGYFSTNWFFERATFLFFWTLSTGFPIGFFHRSEPTELHNGYVFPEWIDHK